MGSAIELESISKYYQRPDGSSFHAVYNLSLSIPKGCIFGFLGANGAGKTTTIKMMCNLIAPSSGIIRLNGYDLQKQPIEAMHQIGAVLEGTRNVYWQLTPYQNLVYFGQLKGVWGNVLTSRIKSLLQQLELWHKKDEPVGGLSRGMQQKVAIACSVIADPPIVLLDEPTLGLDVQASRAIRSWIAHLAQEGKTIVLTTHQLDIVELLCEQIAVIHQGQLIVCKPTQELLNAFQQAHYEIIIETNASHFAHLFPTMNVTEKDGKTIFSGAIFSPNELYDHINKIQSLQLPLISVNRIQDNLETVFVRLLEQQLQ